MNKYLVSLAFFAQVMLFTQTNTANHPFEKLIPSITKDAIIWSDAVITTLSNEMQLAFLNFFALNSESSVQTFMKCAEYIESQLEVKAIQELLSKNIIEKIKKYIDAVQAKIQKKNITKQEETKLLQKLEEKIHELIAYINAIYYHVLYEAISKKNASAPLYMFDDNGIIPQDKRTRALPQPE